MTTAVEKVVFRLRKMILHGEFGPDERIFEKAVADLLGVSRTPVRWALLTLETEGFVTGSPNRGFRVRSYTVSDVFAAYEVRGSLEGLAGRLAVEGGIRDEVWGALDECIRDGDAILQTAPFDDHSLRSWSDLNNRFHRALLEAAGNPALELAFDAVTKIHPASPNALRFSQASLHDAFAAIAAAHEDHKVIVDALRAGRASRVEYLIREHVHNSSLKFKIELEREQQALNRVRLNDRG